VFGAFRAPCICTIGTGEPRRPALVRVAHRTRDKLAAVKYPTNHDRPTMRGECPDTRPCPFVGCPHNNYLEVLPSGDIRFHHPHREPWQVPARESCTLDVAEWPEGATLEEVGRMLNLTRERVRQIEAAGLRKLKASHHDDV
jgi:hypothetical protein